MSYIYHIRAGDIAYTQGMSERSGGNEQLHIARKYFAHALELKPEGNLRALYGILLCCAALGASTKGAGKGTPKVESADLVAYVSPLLIKCYTPSGSNATNNRMRPLVMAMIKKLGGGAGVAQGA